MLRGLGGERRHFAENSSHLRDDNLSERSGVGIRLNANDSHLSPTPLTVPEPGIIYLFALGLAGMGFSRRMKESRLQRLA